MYSHTMKAEAIWNRSGASVASALLCLMTFALLGGCSMATEWGKGKAADAADAKSAKLAADVEAAVPGVDVDEGVVVSAKKIMAEAVKEAMATGDMKTSVDKYAPLIGKLLGALLLSLISGWLGGRKPKLALRGVTEAVEKHGDAGIKGAIERKTSPLVGNWLHTFLKANKIG